METHASSFRFRESERDELLVLLGEWAVMQSPRGPSDLQARLLAARLVERVPGIEPLVAYVLTPAGKREIRRALG